MKSIAIAIATLATASTAFAGPSPEPYWWTKFTPEGMRGGCGEPVNAFYCGLKARDVAQRPAVAPVEEGCPYLHAFACDITRAEKTGLQTRNPYWWTKFTPEGMRGGCGEPVNDFYCGLKARSLDAPTMDNGTAHFAQFVRTVDAAKYLWHSHAPANTTTGYSHLAFLYDFYGASADNSTTPPEGARHNASMDPGCKTINMCDL